MEIPIISEPAPIPPDSSEKIARSFLRNNYPLSEEGKSLRMRVETALESKDSGMLTELKTELPTVESPHLQLFSDLETTPDEDTKYFGRLLTDIQVTKGCSHKCDFCAAGAAASVQQMPYAGILKIAEKVKDEETTLMSQEKRLVEDFRNNITEVVPDFDRRKVQQEYYAYLQGFSDQELDENKQLSTSEFIKQRYPLVYAVYEKTYMNSPYSTNPSAYLSPEEIILDFTLGEAPNKNIKRYRTLTNYYDSDPFDYRDSTFPHLDGTPADYGDVVENLTASGRIIHITTAGWSTKNRIAQRAAEKIVALSRKKQVISNPRVSINPYEQKSKQDINEYLADMNNVIHTLAAGKYGYALDILLFKDENDPSQREFIEKVVKPLEQMKIPGTRFFPAKVSLYSGPMADLDVSDDHHDVMSCMPGYHILPDGTVAYQEHDPESKFGASKGSRPFPIRKSILPSKS